MEDLIVNLLKKNKKKVIIKRCSLQTEIFVKSITDYFDFANFYEEDIRVCKDFEIVNTQLFNEFTKSNRKTIDKEILYDLFFNGHSIIFEQLDTKMACISDICTSIKRNFNCKSWANGYLTPENSQAFPKHVDNHDVVIIQLLGSKKWDINNKVISLDIGDLMFIPKGIVHEAKTKDSISLHITIGIKDYQFSDVFPLINSKINLDEIILINKKEIFNNINSTTQSNKINELINYHFLREKKSIFRTINTIKTLSVNDLVSINKFYYPMYYQDKILLLSEDKKLELSKTFKPLIKYLFNKSFTSVTVENILKKFNISTDFLIKMYKLDIIYIQRQTNNCTQHGFVASGG